MFRSESIAPIIAPAVILSAANKLWHRFILRVLVPSACLRSRWRVTLLRQAGVSVGERACVLGNVRLVSNKVSLGRETFINYDCVLDAAWATITIEDHASLAPQVMIMTATHEVGPSGHRSGAQVGLPVTVGRGCWIGARATLLPGVTVGEGCLVAAGAVVVSDCDPNGFYAGIPARRIRDLPTEGFSTPG